MKKLPVRTIYLISAGTESLASAIMFTLYTVFYINGVGMNPVQLMVVGAVLEATTFIFEVPTGVVADVLSRRLSIILGTFTLGAAFLGMGLMPLFGTILIGQIISGIGYTFLSGANEAWLADEVGEAAFPAVLIRGTQVARGTGLAGILISAPLARLSLSLPFIIGGTLYLVLGVLLWALMPEQGFEQKRGVVSGPSFLSAMWNTFRAGFRAARSSPTLLVILTASAFMGASSEGLDRLSQAHLLKSFQIPSLGPVDPIYWFSLLSFITAAAVILLMGWLKDPIEKICRSDKSLLPWLILLMGITITAIAGFALAPTFLSAAMALSIIAVSRALAEPIYRAWLIRHTEPEIRATLISIIAQTNAMGQIGGGPAVGWVGTRFNLSAAMAVTALLLLPVTGLFARVFRKLSKKSRIAN
jgi:MFS family permease